MEEDAVFRPLSERVHVGKDRRGHRHGVRLQIIVYKMLILILIGTFITCSMCRISILSKFGPKLVLKVF